MSISEFYDAIGADFSDAAMRFGSEQALAEFLPRFAQDETFAALCAAMEHRHLEDAFRAAHTLKGLAANFGFSALLESAAALTELLRAGSFSGTDEAFEKTKAAYRAILCAMQENNII